MTAAIRGNATIDGVSAIRAELSVHQERIDVSTRGPQPDPQWSTVDDAGHFHARSVDGMSYPTLNVAKEHRDCDGCDDGDCEGYDATVWTCRICGVRVEPGMVPGPHYATVPGLQSWEMRATVMVPPRMGADVSVRFEAPGGVLFGVAVVHQIDVARMVGGARDTMDVTVVLAGNGSLGRMPAEPAPAPVEDPSRLFEQFIADAQVALTKLRKAAA